jgi:hypothetical protein
MGNKTPVIRGRSVTIAKGGAETDVWFQGSPAIIIVTAPPTDPGRRPVCAGDPHPPITILEEPAAIMEGGPAPGITGIPGPTLIGVHPLSIAGIGLKVWSRIGQPDISVIRIIYPLPVRTQVIIKSLQRDILGVILRRRLRSGRGLRGRVLVNNVDRAARVEAHGQNGQVIQVCFHTSAF